MSLELNASAAPATGRPPTVAEIEARQDAVLRQLEELELRLISVLAEHGVSVSLPGPDASNVARNDADGSSPDGASPDALASAAAEGAANIKRAKAA
jgi:hypothetical protein